MQTDELLGGAAAGATLETESRSTGIPLPAPGIDPADESGPYVVVAVDSHGGDLDFFDAHGTLIDSETTERTAGEFAEFLAKRYDALHVDQIFLVGVVPTRPEVIRALPERVRSVVTELEVGSRADGSESELVRSAVHEVRERRALLASSAG